jgi:hypothetical protein
MLVPPARLAIGILVASAAIFAGFLGVGADALGPWGQLALTVASMLIVVAFAPAYFGLGRIHRRR